ncbi:MAG TPA: sigma-70 family RNA polymerase sigma factor [Planctomycetota bacterium]|nr:sigma-70 family RNA polymerase sigma factor [Planctomycetota bacterium]
MKSSTEQRRFLQKFVSGERLLMGYLLSATGDFHEAEDLLQEVSVALWESFDRYDESKAFHAWALGIARHKVLDWREKQGRRGATLSPEILDLVGQAQLETADRLSDRRPLLQTCIEALPDHLRKIVQLRYREQLTLEALSERLDRSAGAVQVALVRIRRTLRDCVDQKLGPLAEAGR